MKKRLEVSGAIFVRDGRVFAARRGESVYPYVAHKYEFVGGKVEKGESKEEAIIRECREELAIDIAVDDIFTEVTHDYPDIAIHLTLFNSRIVGGQLTLLEHNAMAWITPSEIGNYDFCPADKVILAKIKEIIA